MEQAIIRTTNLTRRFGQRSSPIVAVNRLALHVPRGSVYGFLGPNGAGKTTTIRMLLGLMRPDEGETYIFGEPLRRKRLDLLRRIGALVETPSLYPHLTGWENLEVIRRMIGGTRTQVGHALNLVHLDGDSGRLVREYSLGMRQRLGLAMAFLSDPELLVLDEPTNGLDPAGIREIRELLCELPKREGVTVFLSSHLLNEIEQIGTHIGIINQGRLIFQGTPEELRARQRDQLTLVTDRLAEAQQFLHGSGWQVSHNGNNHLSIEVNGRSDAALINAQLVRAGLNVYELRLAQPSLEDIFLNLTKEEAPQ